MKTKIIALVLCLTLFAVIIPASAEKMYALDGRSIIVAKTEREAYRKVGWYDEPVKTMYAPDGRSIIVYVSEAKDYRKVGWYDEPVKKMYTPDGKSSIVYVSEARAYRQVGWYDEPVTYVYSLNGKKSIVYEKELAKWEEEGWYKEPFAVMTKNGASKCIVQSEIQKYRAEGWMVSRFYSSLYELGEQLEKFIGKKSGSYGIYIKNLKTDEALIINDGQYSSASIIKLFVMAGIYNEVDKGRLEYSKTVQSNLWSMITVSDNYASNRLVKMIGGGNYLKGFNRENEFSKSVGCLATQHMSLFAGCGEYVSYGRNLVSPLDCGIMLEKIYKGTLISKTYSSQMLNLLKNQTRRGKIPYLLPRNTVCANKTGETSRVQSDVGIVYSPNCDYIICVLTNNASTGITDIQKISKMTYDYFN